MNSYVECVMEILTINFLYHKLDLKTYTCPAFDYSNIKYKFYANQPVVVTSNDDRTESKYGNLYDNEVGAEQLKTPSSGIIHARLRQVSLVTVTLKIINSVYGRAAVGNFNIQSELQKKKIMQHMQKSFLLIYK